MELTFPLRKYGTMTNVIFFHSLKALRKDVTAKLVGISLVLKEYRMVFRAGLRHPCTRDVARVSESVKNHEQQASDFYLSETQATSQVQG